MGLLDRFKGKKEKELATSDAPKQVEAVKKTKTEGPKDVAKKDVVKKETRKAVRAETARVIIAPLVTEKAAHLVAARTYVFRVDTRATRVQVASAFKELYGIVPTRVNIVNSRRESVRFGRSMGKQKAIKKAMITVPKGKEIQIYEGI